MTRIMPLIMTLFFAQGCGQKATGAGADRLGPDADPVASTRGTRALVTPPRRFVAHVGPAERLTVIDQETEAEAFGIDVAGEIDATMPAARFDGIATLRSEGLTIYSAGLEREFPFSYAGSEWDAASDEPAFAFAEDGRTRVIRHLGEDEWQDSPLTGASPGAEDVPVLGADGTWLVTINTTDGNYATHRASSTTSAMASELACASTGLASPIVALGRGATQVYWGNAVGGLGVVDSAAAGCEPLTAVATLPDALEVARFVPRTPTSILVFAIGGRVFDWDGAAGVAAFASLAECDFPLSPVALADDDLAALCLTEIDTSNPRKVTYQAAAYRYFPKANSKAIYAKELVLGEVAGLGIDAPTKRLFVLADSALGRMTVVDLPTGVATERRGLFLRDIID